MNISKFKKLILVAGFVTTDLLLMFAVSVRPLMAAEQLDGTYVSGNIAVDTVWSKSASPYVVEANVFVNEGATLTIEPGVEVLRAPETQADIDSYRGRAIYIRGSLVMRGTPDERITLRRIVKIHGSFSKSIDIAYTDFLDGPNLILFGSQATVSSSTIQRADGSCLYIAGSKVNVRASQLYKCGKAGIFIYNNIGTPRVDIRDSSIFDIGGPVFWNMTGVMVYAQGNWWGSPDGPPLEGPTGIIGPVTYKPWLDHDPHPPVDQADCCSSVLFIPGLEGSRLHLPDNRLWEPNRNADVKKLYLTTAGSSTDPGVYSGGPIDKALGVKSIYGGFMTFMDGLVREGKIGEWRAFGYDWRKPVTEVVAGAEKKATTTESLIGTVETLASRSPTGKVSIVAHSNGGLVAKELVRLLTDRGDESLIDTVISVAVPYLGTPAAIGALLHGDGQNLLGGLIASAANMRSLGLNMASAYSLLPSKDFFQKTFGPVIAFASTTPRTINNGTYPRSIASFEDQVAFVADESGSRGSVKVGDIDTPARGNLSLLMAAELIHGILDPFRWPVMIAKWAIVGWNKETVDGVKYTEKGERDFSVTPYGDGTVVAPSATHEPGRAVSMDLSKLSDVGGDIDHVNILESSAVQSTVGSILTKPTDRADKVIEEISKLPGVTIGELDWFALDAAYKASRKELKVSTHSPVNLHVYDSQGRHTGVIQEPEGLDEELEEGFMIFTEEGIPGSRLTIQGEGEHLRTYITLPDGGETYSAVVEGFGVGEFTLDIERIRATSTIERVEWVNVPVTPFTVASTTIVSDPRFEVASTSLAVAKPTLSVDIEGDGKADKVLESGVDRRPGLHMELLKKHFGWFVRRTKRHAKWENLEEPERSALQAAIVRVKHVW